MYIKQHALGGYWRGLQILQLYEDLYIKFLNFVVLYD